jgi:ribosomal protein S8
MNYYEVVVNIKTEAEGYKGATKIKNVKETYLVDAMSCTEAEARVVKVFSESGFSQDYEVISVRGSKVIQVIEAKKSLKDFEVKTKKEDLED